MDLEGESRGHLPAPNEGGWLPGRAAAASAGSELPVLPSAVSPRGGGLPLTLSSPSHHPGKPDVVVSQLLQDLHIHLVLEGLGLQGSLEDLVGELIDGAHPLGRVVTHVLEHRWGAVKEGRGQSGSTGREAGGHSLQQGLPSLTLWPWPQAAHPGDGHSVPTLPYMPAAHPLSPGPLATLLQAPTSQQESLQQPEPTFQIPNPTVPLPVAAGHSPSFLTGLGNLSSIGPGL